MKRINRSLSMMIAAPLVAAAVVASPVASAWTIGSNYYTYQYTDQREKTTIPAQTRVVSGTDYITTEASNCARQAFYYKKNNYFYPTTVVMSLGMTTSDLCGTRAKSGQVGDQGNQSIFGNYKASRAVPTVRNWIEG